MMNKNPSTKDAKQAKILLVDDEVQICSMIATILEMEGYMVLTAYDGEDALNQIHIHKPDLIICDRAMPGKSGDDLLYDLRNNSPHFSDVPFIFMTALTGLEHQKSVEHLKPYAYLEKPANFSQMLGCIKEALQ